MDAELLGHIRARLDYVECQAQSGIERGPLQSASANALELTLRHSKVLSLDEVTTITHEVSSGPWTSAERVQMAKAIVLASCVTRIHTEAMQAPSVVTTTTSSFRDQRKSVSSQVSGASWV